MSSIIVTVNLEGIIGGNVSHTTFQRHTIALSEEFGSSMTKVIKHTDREVSVCKRVFQVPSNVVKSWVKDATAPYWEKPSDWAKMSEEQRVYSHVQRFDEGFGVSYESLGDGGL